MIFADVNEDEFELNKEFEKSGIIYKEVRLKNRGCRCLKCGTFTTKIKEYRLKKFIHSIYNNTQIVVLFHQRRFVCPKLCIVNIHNLAYPFFFDYVCE